MTAAEIAIRIVNRALRDENAVETRISVATLLLAIESELKKRGTGQNAES